MSWFLKLLYLFNFRRLRDNCVRIVSTYTISFICCFVPLHDLHSSTERQCTFKFHIGGVENCISVFGIKCFAKRKTYHKGLLIKSYIFLGYLHTSWIHCLFSLFLYFLWNILTWFWKLIFFSWLIDHSTRIEGYFWILEGDICFWHKCRILCTSLSFWVTISIFSWILSI